jgi:hypothetical protein
MNLLQSLNIIENKLEKESDSSQSGSHKPSDEKKKSGNVSRHHHHSLKHSNKRAGRNTIPSPVR